MLLLQLNKIIFNLTIILAGLRAHSNFNLTTNKITRHHFFCHPAWLARAAATLRAASELHQIHDFVDVKDITFLHSEFLVHINYYQANHISTFLYSEL